MNNKKIAAIILFGLTMTTCSTPAIGEVQTKNSSLSIDQTSSLGLVSMMKEQKIKQAQLEKIARDATKIKADTALVNKSLTRLKSHVGKTWYVFSGSSPSGWDCSGLTLWFYEQSGITLTHRASVQDDSGIKTTTPKPGDLVVFKYTNSKQAYHVGIYIGEDQMIHAPAHGQLTRVEGIKSFGGKYSSVSYREIIKTS